MHSAILLLPLLALGSDPQRPRPEDLGAAAECLRLPRSLAGWSGWWTDTDGARVRLESDDGVTLTALNGDYFLYLPLRWIEGDSDGSLRISRWPGDKRAMKGR